MYRRSSRCARFCEDGVRSVAGIRGPTPAFAMAAGFQNQFPKPARAQRNLKSSFPCPIDRGASSIACANSGPAGIAPASPAPLIPSGLSGDASRRDRARYAHIERGRQEILGERRIEQLSVLVEHELLVERIADPCATPPVDLSRQDQRIDHRAAIVHHDVSADVEAPSSPDRSRRSWRGRRSRWRRAADRNIGSPPGRARCPAAPRRASDWP